MTDAPRNSPEPPRSDRVAKAIRYALMAGSAVFLAERYLLKIDVDPALIVAAFFGVAAGVLAVRIGDKA